MECARLYSVLNAKSSTLWMSIMHYREDDPDILHILVRIRYLTEISVDNNIIFVVLSDRAYLFRTFILCVTY